MNRLMLPEKTREIALTERFGGYNHNLRIGEGEFYDMENLTSSHYPLLAPREKRGIYAEASSPAGLIAKDSLCYVDGSRFVMDGYAMDLGLSEEGPKTLVSMGAYVIIFPDGKYINTADLTDTGSLDAEVTAPGPVTFSLCRADGTDLKPDYTQPGEPVSPENMQFWLDTSAMALKQWADTSGMWVDVPATYVKISAPGIGAPFSQYDGITVTGLNGVLTDSLTGEALENPDQLQALEGANVIQARAEDYIVITGILEISRTIQNPVAISRKMPRMDFVVERENRLWGCRYGLNREGQVVNEIYASKLGDFKNWNCFMGISTDSYTVSLGSDGPFTGAAVFGGYPLFFKENCVHKVFGDYPANFGIQTTACRGVQRGSYRSLAIVGELLYYKSGTGVCVYDGALPREISAPLGQVRYRNALAAGFRNKYYIAMEEEDTGAWCLFVYDTQRFLWHREGGVPMLAICGCRDGLYAIEADTGRILRLAGTGEAAEEAVSWMALTGELGLELPQQKYISRMTVRMRLEPGSWVRFFIRYDGMGDWVPLCTVTGNGTESFFLPIRPRRCDHFQLRLEGQGEARIYSWQKTLARGSDRTCALN